MTNLFEMQYLQSPPFNNNITCIVKEYVNNSISFYASQTCPDISDKCHSHFNPNNEILGQLQEISRFIDIFLTLRFPTALMSFKKTIHLPLATTQCKLLMVP